LLPVVFDPKFNLAREGGVEFVALDYSLAGGRENQFARRYLLNQIMGGKTAKQGGKLTRLDFSKCAALAKDIVQTGRQRAARLPANAEYLMNTRTEMKAIILRWLQPPLAMQFKEGDSPD
jgi:hypothetical protein